LLLNSIWGAAYAFNVPYLSSLSLFFNWYNKNIALDILLNIVTFNWLYIFYKFLIFWKHIVNFCVNELNMGLVVSVLLSWYYCFNELNSTWLLIQPLSSGDFFRNFKDYINGFSIENVKGFTSFFCPRNLIVLVSGSVSNIDFASIYNITSSLLKNDVILYYDFLFTFAFLLFIFSTVASFLIMSYLGLYGVFIFNGITIFFFWIITVIKMDYFLYNNGKLFISLGKWFTLHNYTTVNFELLLDSLSYSYVLLTLTIATAVYFYTFSYFRYEPNVERLLLLINSFVISMLLLVTSSNLFVLFLGWEAIGITSFLLIGFWASKISSLKSAFKAMSFNKFSDVSLFISITATYVLCESSNIFYINSNIQLYQNNFIAFGLGKISSLEFISFFFLSAAFVKSAQFGTHIWLPDSMDAPVPASSLIHSATLVSAGIFLILRFSPIFSYSIYADTLLLLVGSFTAFFGAWSAMYQTDLKRILAYSTMSHCGFLMVTCFLKNPELSIFYLYVHGFFKASIFLCVGNIIRFANNYQDIRRMGMFWKYLPFESVASLICLVNLAGLPFTLGFNMKHLMLASIKYNSVLVLISFFFLIVGVLAGFVYSYKIYNYVFLDFKKAKKYIYKHTNSSKLKSEYYSNTTLAASISIFFLIIVGYLICLYNYYNWCTLFNVSESLDFIYLELSNIYNIKFSLLSFLSFLSFLNWFSILLYLGIVFSTWRFNIFYYESYNNFFTGLLFILFVYINLIIIC